MNDIFGVVTGLLTHAYYIASGITLISLVPRMLLRALNKKSPI